MNGSLIAVDAPPAKENSRPFVAIARALRAHGVHVPEVLAADFEQGFMLLEDFGDALLRPALNDASWMICMGAPWRRWCTCWGVTRCRVTRCLPMIASA
jgi:hypothetical protein